MKFLLRSMRGKWLEKTNILGLLVAIILMSLPLVSYSKIDCYSKTGTVSCSGCNGCNGGCLASIGCGAMDGPCGCSGSAYKNDDVKGDKIVNLGYKANKTVVASASKVEARFIKNSIRKRHTTNTNAGVTERLRWDCEANGDCYCKGAFGYRPREKCIEGIGSPY